jgi:lysozyme family protein
METPAFRNALAFILRWEGGFVDDPDDPGGRTNKGITQKTYNRWRQRQGLGQADVLHIDPKEVDQIYVEGYWVPPHCPELAQHLDLIQFDTAVNMGVRRAVMILQEGLGCKADGQFGPITAKAAHHCDPDAVMKVYCDIREGFYRRLVERKPRLKKFLRGWLNRLNALRGEVGLVHLELPFGVDFGDAGHIAKVPDLEEGELMEPWR